jgi:hypothetical protein
MHQGCNMAVINATTLIAVWHVQPRQGALRRPQHRLQARCPRRHQPSALSAVVAAGRARTRRRVRVCRAAMERLQHCLKGR